MAGGAKLGIIYQSETLRKRGANRFLKTLEEPPPLTYFILLTSRLERLLPTLRSRSHIIRFQPLPPDVVAERLHSECNIATGSASELVARISRGRQSLAYRIAEDSEAYTSLIRSYIEVYIARKDSVIACRTAHACAKRIKDSRSAFEEECAKKIAVKNKELSDAETATRRAVVKEYEEELKSAQAARERDEKADIFDALITIWRDVWVYSCTGDSTRLVYSFAQKEISRLAEIYTAEEIRKNIHSIELVRGPTVYLNARLDVILQGLLMQATQPVQARTPLRRAIAATGL
jgi:DNA polymerase III delta prime subunit